MTHVSVMSKTAFRVENCVIEFISETYYSIANSLKERIVTKKFQEMLLIDFADIPIRGLFCARSKNYLAAAVRAFFVRMLSAFGVCGSSYFLSIEQFSLEQMSLGVLCIFI